MRNVVQAVLHVLVCLVRAVSGMHQAGPGRDNYVHLLPKKRFMAQVADLYLTNDLSAEKFSSLVGNAKLAGAQTGRTKTTSSKNLARDTRRRIGKNKKWPRPYLVNIPCENPKTNETIAMCVPLWLPHEICYCFQQHCRPRWMDRSGLAPQLLDHISEIERQEGIPSGELVALALWSDGVPFNNNRLKSIELGALSFPGLQDDLRIPLWAIPKDFIVTNVTIKSIFQVMKWSFEILLRGQMPSCRHNGAAWQDSDRVRAKWSGSALNRGVLAQIRGDWMCYKSHFNLSGSLAVFCIQKTRRHAVRDSCFSC